MPSGVHLKALRGTNALLAGYPAPPVLRLHGTGSYQAWPGQCLQACGRGPAGARPPDEKLTLKTGDRGHSSISPGSCLSIRVWSPSQRLEVGVRTSARSPPPYPPLAAPVIGNCLFLGLFSVSLASMEWQLLDSRVQESRGGNGGSNTHPCPGGQLHSLHCSSSLSSREALQLVAL